MASVWIRCLQLIPYLEELGISCHLNLHTRVPDVAIFLRRYGRSDLFLAKTLRMLGARVVLDIVANYYEPNCPNPAGVGVCSPKAREHFLKLHDIADEVWCVSPYLVEQASRYHPRVIFVSDSIDFRHYSQVKEEFGNTLPFRLGWSGVAAKADALKQVKPLLMDSGFELLVISDQRPDLDMPFLFRRWSYQRFPLDIVQCDLCVAPRAVATSYDHSHSLYKVGVFMAEGVPAIASAVPSYRLVLNDGAAGKLCENPESMLEEIRKCSANRDMLTSWSQVARQRMKEYSCDRIAAQIARKIHDLAGSDRYPLSRRSAGGDA
jgi:glycosyltransferase involved in cell wall biosynthesis